MSYDDIDDCADELNRTDELKEYRTLYQTVNQDNPLNVKQKASPKSPEKQKPKPKNQKRTSNKRSLQTKKKKKEDKKGPLPPPTTIEDNNTKYSPKRTKLFETKCRDEEEDYPYNPITIEEENEFLSSFQMPPNVNMVANPETMCKLAHPDEFLKMVCKHLNAYALKQTELPQESLWIKTNQQDQQCLIQII